MSRDTKRTNREIDSQRERVFSDAIGPKTEIVWKETDDGLKPFMVSDEEDCPPREVIWTPQAGSQTAFLQCDDFEVLYEGTRGPGKTDSLIMDFRQFVGLGFGAEWKGILFRQTYKQLGDVITKTKKWFHQIDPGAKFNTGDSYWEWSTGERLLLRHFDKEDDYWNYHGHEYPWIAWEELCNWHTLNGYKRMQSCCRSSNKRVPRRYRATTNPYGPGHNAVKARFRLPLAPGRIVGKLIDDAVDDEGKLERPRRAIRGSLQENKILLAADPGYVQTLRSAARNKTELKAWLHGSWDIVSGGMIDDIWDPRVHVIKPFDIPPSWYINRSFDWGSSKPFSVGWWAESDGTDYKTKDGNWRSTVRGDLFRINEWYGWNGKPNEGSQELAVNIAKGIIEREKKWDLYGRVKAGPADNSINDMENGVSIAVDMMKPVRLGSGEQVNGIFWTLSDKRSGSRKSGWEQLRMMLQHAKRSKEGIPREKPGLFIFNNCEHWVRTVPVLPRDQKDPDDVDTDSEDHVADETRYRIRAQYAKVSSGGSTGGY